jgi:hypothetical protein
VVDNNSSRQFKRKQFYGINIKFILVCLKMWFQDEPIMKGIKKVRGVETFFSQSDTLLINNAIKILSDHLSKVGIC